MNALKPIRHYYVNHKGKLYLRYKWLAFETIL